MATNDNMNFDIQGGELLSCDGDEHLIDIPDGVRVIGEECFMMSMASRITVPKSVREVRSGAFQYASRLHEVFFEDGTRVIEDCVFESCDELETVLLPNTLRYIGPHAFAGCDALQYNEHEGSKYIGSEENPYLVLMKGEPNSSGILFVHEDCRFIYDEACINNERLITAVLPQGVLSIGDGAFAGCSSLRDIALPESVERIGAEAFRLASRLIRHEENCCYYLPSDKNLCFALIDYDIDFDADVFIPADGTSVIADGVFTACGTFTAVEIPQSIRVLPRELFKSCHALKYAVLPEGLVEIGDSCFENCSHLEIINFPESLLRIGACAFSSCQSLDGVYLPWGVERLGYDAFCTCKSLKELILPERIKMIPTGCFCGTALCEVTVPAGVERLGRRAFKGCKEISRVTLPEGLIEIYGEVFAGCSGLTEINLPNSLSFLGDYAFQDCWRLCEITLPHGLDGALMPSLFQDCIGLSEITVPEGITEIGARAFQGCHSLTRVTLPGSCESIGHQAFSACGALIELNIPSALKTVREGAFDDCSSLPYLVIEHAKYFGDAANPTAILIAAEESFGAADKIARGTRIIMTDAFSSCALTEITIPPTVTYIGERAFSGLGITEITIPESVIEIDDNAFEKCASLERVLGMRGVRTIGFEAFSHCTALREVEVGERLEKIHEFAFSNCVSLEYFDVPDSLHTVGDFAFCCCESLAVIGLPFVISLGDGAFSGCRSLLAASFPRVSGVIGSGTFADCTMLRELMLSPELHELETEAIKGCESLQRVTVLGASTKIPAYLPEGCGGVRFIIRRGSLAELICKLKNLEFEFIDEE